LDKNYAGMFIIWDRMFGTFEPEIEEPVYGLTKPLASWNPLWANLHAWVELAQDAWRAPRWRDKIKIWFMPLGWTPPGLPEGPRAQPITREALNKYDPKLPLALNLYIVVHFVLTLVLSVMVLDLSDADAPLGSLIVPALLVLWALANLGGILERKIWNLASELVRLAALPALAAWWFETDENSWLMIAAVSGLSALSAAWLLSQRAAFLHSELSSTPEDAAYDASTTQVASR
jgi:hypothetical protein